jgi:hypothetical protein
MPAVRISRWLIVSLASLAAARETCAQSPAPPAAAAPTAQATAPPAFTPAQQQAREAVLNSPAWQEEQRKFHAWLGVQTTYDAAQIAAMKQEFAARIAAMNADQLRTFLANMQQRLAVLLSPEVAQARNWADEFYTRQGKLDLLKRYGLADPMSMPAGALEAALAKFAAERQEMPAAQAAFQQGLAAQASANAQRAQAEQQAAQAAAAASAAARAASGSSSYAPTRVRNQGVAARYAPAYPIPYGIGPWGGVWYGW